MADLVLGPLLRHVGERDATIWVETDAPCEVEVLGHTARTFQIRRHHYALVIVEGLEPGSSNPYEVRLDGERRWPLPDHDVPPSVIRTVAPGEPLTLAYGSCRVAMPHTPPYTCSKDEDEHGFELDALYVLALEMIRGTRENWPEVLVLLGDQVYVDEGSPVARARIRWERDTSTPPYEETGTYEEYTWLYQESWGDPMIRWLLSTVSTSMVWDDHDMHDDWNISRSWVEEMNRHDWWRIRVVDGFMSYWVYQHLGNLSPRALADDEVWQRIQGTDDATGILHDFAEGAHQTGAGSRWSFCRDIDGTRLIVMDSRAGRVLEKDRRSIFDDEEWEWIVEQVDDDGYDHLLLATSDPYLLAPGMHHLEAWNEMVCDGAWGKTAAKLGERLRRSMDFDHWAAFKLSFERLANLLEETGSGRRGEAPASIVVLSGDVHHAYLAEVDFPGNGVSSAVYQATCSPFRNPLDARERRAIKAMCSRPAERAMRALARSAGAPDPGIRWRICDGPYFDNQVGTLRVEGRSIEARLDKTKPGEHRERRLERTYKRTLT